MLYDVVDDEVEYMNHDEIQLYIPYDLDFVGKQVLYCIVYHIKYIDDKKFLIVLNNPRMFAL
jgi:hypothetical protein